jgi:hypothetical protein
VQLLEELDDEVLPVVRVGVGVRARVRVGVRVRVRARANPNPNPNPNLPVELGEREGGVAVVL